MQLWIGFWSVYALWFVLRSGQIRHIAQNRCHVQALRSLYGDKEVCSTELTRQLSIEAIILLALGIAIFVSRSDV